MSTIDVTFVQEVFSAGRLGGVVAKELVIHEWPNFPADALPGLNEIVVFAPPDTDAIFPEWKVVGRVSDDSPIVRHYYEHGGVMYTCAKVYIDRAE